MKARYVRPDDEDAVVELARMQVEETLPHLNFNEIRARASFRRAISSGVSVIFVAETAEGEVIGHIIAHVWPYMGADGFFVSQEMLYVRPDKRGSRAAAELFDLYSKWADSIEANEVFAGIANGHNPERTEKFMKKFGFERVGYSLRRIKRTNDNASVVPE